MDFLIASVVLEVEIGLEVERQRNQRCEQKSHFFFSLFALGLQKGMLDLCC